MQGDAREDGRTAPRKAVGKSKVTLSVEAALIRRAKIAAIERGTTLSELVKQGLRAVLKGG